MVKRGSKRARWLLVVPMFLGCSSKAVTHRTWHSLSEDELQTRLSAPTADLSLSLNAERVSDLETRMPALVELGRFLGQVIGAVSDVTNTDYASAEAKLPDVEEAPAESDERGWGTNLYLRLACPGVDPLHRVTDFSAGEVRLDSDRIRSLDLRKLMDGGEFLLSFRRCQLGSMNFEAELPGRYTVDAERLRMSSSDTEAPVFAIALSADDIEQRGTASPVGLLMVGCGGSQSCDEDLRVAAELKTAAGSFVVTFRALRSFWSGQALSLRIDGADSSSECEYTNAPGVGPKVICESE